MKNNNETKDKDPVTTPEKINEDVDEGGVYASDDNVGIILKKARISCDYSIYDIAIKLYVPNKYITFIEEDNYDALPSLLFARGYVRAYAELLGLDEKKIMDLFSKDVGSSNSTQKDKDIHVADKLQKIQKEQQSIAIYISVAVVLVVCIIGLLVYFSNMESMPVINETNRIQKNNQEIEPQPLTNPVAVIDDFNLVAGNKTENPPIKLDDDILPLKLTDDVPARVNIVEEKIITENQEKHVIVFSFEGDCWIKITSSQDGERIFAGYKSEGDVISISEHAQVDVVLGSADVVEVSLNGSNFDFSERILSSTRVARFSIPSSE